MQHILRYAILPRPDYSSWWPVVRSTWAQTLTVWRHRIHTRHELATLDDRALADIGLTRADQWCECRKPFWRA